jgi:hypothetical protein
MPAHHHRPVREFLLCSGSPNGIRFLQLHHLNEEITAADVKP